MFSKREKEIERESVCVCERERERERESESEHDYDFQALVSFCLRQKALFFYFVSFYNKHSGIQG